jgi:hypothetical protein
LLSICVKGIFFDILEVQNNAFFYHVVLLLIMQVKHLLVIITVVEIQDLEVLLFHDWLIHFLRVNREQLMHDLLLYGWELVEQLDEPLFPDREAFHPLRALVHKAELLVVKYLKPADDRAHSKLLTHELFLVDFISNLVLPSFHENDLQAFFKLVGDHLIPFKKPCLQRIQELNHKVTKDLVVINFKIRERNGILQFIGLTDIELLGFLFEPEKSAELIEEVLVNELGVQVDLTCLWQLIKHHLVLICHEEAIFVVVPFVLHKDSNL